LNNSLLAELIKLARSIVGIETDHAWSESDYRRGVWPWLYVVAETRTAVRCVPAETPTLKLVLRIRMGVMRVEKI